MNPRLSPGAEVLDGLRASWPRRFRRTLAESPQVALASVERGKDGFDVSLVARGHDRSAHVEGGRELDRAFDFESRNPEPNAAEMTPLDRKFLALASDQRRRRE